MLSRADLVRAFRGEQYRDDAYTNDADERAVEVHMGNIRHKLRHDPDSPRWLQTVRGADTGSPPPDHANHGDTGTAANTGPTEYAQCRSCRR